MEMYRLVSRKFEAVQLTNQNIKDVYDWLKPRVKVDVTLGTSYSVTMHTKPYYLVARPGQYIAIDENGEILVRNEYEFNRYFKKV